MQGAAAIGKKEGSGQVSRSQATAEQAVCPSAGRTRPTGVDRCALLQIHADSLATLDGSCPERTANAVPSSLSVTGIPAAAGADSADVTPSGSDDVIRRAYVRGQQATAPRSHR